MKKNGFILVVLLNIAPILQSVSKAQVCPVPEVNLGNDTLICPDGSLYLDAGIYKSVIWNNGTTGRYLLVTQPGTYSVTVTNDCGNTATDEIVIGLAEVPEVLLSYQEKQYYCKGEIVNLAAEVVSTSNGLIYEWLEKNSTDSNINVDTTGTYTLRVTNEYGCKTMKEVNLEFQYPYEKDKILLTTFDPSEGKNIIIWSRTPDQRTQSFLLYRGNTVNDFLAETNFASVNLYVDKDSDPAARPSQYNIQVLDSCNNRSAFNPEKLHRTMHLNAYTDADGNATLEWTPYIGFNYTHFYIYQGTEPARLSLVDSIPFDPKADRMTYIDRTAKEGVLYYYDIRVKTPEIIYLDNPDRKKAGSGPFVHSLSNLEDNMLHAVGMDPLEIMNQYLSVYPNPVRDKVRISFRNETGNNISFILYDITGGELVRINQENPSAGNYTLVFDPADYGLRQGIFILKMNIENVGSLTRKVIKY